MDYSGLSANWRALSTILWMLQSGENPRDFAEMLGRGAFKTAYRFGNFVIKPNIGRDSLPDLTMPAKLKEFGFTAPFQITTNDGEWIIQKYVQTVALLNWDEISKQTRAKIDSIERKVISWNTTHYPTFDMHSGNFGIDENQNIVAFDW